MEIKKRKKKIPHKFEMLKNGEVFEHDDKAYIKISCIENNLSEIYNAVNLECGSLIPFNANEGVHKKPNAYLELN